MFCFADIRKLGHFETHYVFFSYYFFWRQNVSGCELPGQTLNSDLTRAPFTGKGEFSAYVPPRFATAVSNATGSTAAFVIALVVVIIWGASGPVFHYSENWQLIIKTGTTIITFLMVFLVQKAQNKDSLSIQLKLNEIVAAHAFASSRLVNVENIWNSSYSR